MNSSPSSTGVKRPFIHCQPFCKSAKSSEFRSGTLTRRILQQIPFNIHKIPSQTLWNANLQQKFPEIPQQKLPAFTTKL
jgi:hypothetical protein